MPDNQNNMKSLKKAIENGDNVNVHIEVNPDELPDWATTDDD